MGWWPFGKMRAGGRSFIVSSLSESWEQCGDIFFLHWRIPPLSPPRERGSLLSEPLGKEGEEEEEGGWRMRRGGDRGRRRGGGGEPSKSYCSM